MAADPKNTATLDRPNPQTDPRVRDLQSQLEQAISQRRRFYQRRNELLRTKPAGFLEQVTQADTAFFRQNEDNVATLEHQLKDALPADQRAAVDQLLTREDQFLQQTYPLDRTGLRLRDRYRQEFASRNESDIPTADTKPTDAFAAEHQRHEDFFRQFEQQVSDQPAEQSVSSSAQEAPTQQPENADGQAPEPAVDSDIQHLQATLNELSQEANSLTAAEATMMRPVTEISSSPQTDRPPQPEGALESAPERTDVNPQDIPLEGSLSPANGGGNGQPPAESKGGREAGQLPTVENLTMLRDFTAFVKVNRNRVTSQEDLGQAMTAFLASPRGQKYADIAGLSETYLFNELHDFAAINTPQELFEYIDTIENQLDGAVVLASQIEKTEHQTGRLTPDVLAAFRKDVEAGKMPRGLSYDEVVGRLDQLQTKLAAEQARDFLEHKLTAEVAEKDATARDAYTQQVREAVIPKAATTGETTPAAPQEEQTKQPLQPEPSEPVESPAISTPDSQAAVFLANHLYEQNVPLDAESIATHVEQNKEQLMQNYLGTLAKTNPVTPEVSQQAIAAFATVTSQPHIFVPNETTSQAIATATNTKAFANSLATFRDATYFATPITTPGDHGRETSQGRLSTADQSFEKKLREQFERLEAQHAIMPPGASRALDAATIKKAAFAYRQAFAHYAANPNGDFNAKIARELKSVLGDKLRLSERELIDNNFGEGFLDNNERKQIETASLYYQFGSRDQQAPATAAALLSRLQPEFAREAAFYERFADQDIAAQHEELTDAVTVAKDTLEEAPEIIADAHEQPDAPQEVTPSDTPFSDSLNQAAVAGETISPTDRQIAGSFDTNPEIIYGVIGAAKFLAMYELAVAKGDVQQAAIFSELYKKALHYPMHEAQKHAMKKFLDHYYGNSFSKWILKSKTLKALAGEYASMPMAFAKMYAITGAKIAVGAPIVLPWRYLSGPRMPKVANPNKITAKEIQAAQKYAQKWHKYRQSRRYKYFHQPVIQRLNNYKAWTKYWTVDQATAVAYNLKAAFQKTGIGKSATKLGSVLKKALKPFNKLGFWTKAVFEKIASALMAWSLMQRLLKLYKRIVAITSIYLFFLWHWLLGQIGALIGATIGTVVGSVVGAVIGFKIGVIVGAALGEALCFGFFLCGVVGGALGGMLGGFLGGLLGAAIGGTVGAILGYAFQAVIIPNLAGAGIGASIGFAFGGPYGAVAGAYVGAQAEALLKKFVFPHIGTNIEFFLSNLLHGIGTFIGNLASLFGQFLSSLGEALISGASSVFGAIGGLFSSAAGALAVSFTLVIGTIVVGVLVTTDDTGTTPTQTQIKITAPDSVNNNQTIPYKITADFSNCDSSVDIKNQVPSNTTLQSVDPPLFQNGQNVDSIQAIISQATGGTMLEWQIAIKPGNCNGNSSGTVNGPNANATDFPTLLRGQGRDTKIFQNENDFVTKMLQNSKGALNGQDANLHTLYQQALQSNVNPLIIVTFWGEEAGFGDNNGTQFGCKPFGSGFTAQVTCAINTVNGRMGDWESAAKSPGFSGKVAVQKVPPGFYDDSQKDDQDNYNCYYDDATLYMFEVYGPVCHYNDGNGDVDGTGHGKFRDAYYTIYKQLLGAG